MFNIYESEVGINPHVCNLPQDKIMYPELVYNVTIFVQSLCNLTEKKQSLGSARLPQF